ncbi:DUF4157 domain-containing protein [Undibacterium sp. CY21W]|uniref:eCIS core domain-containing protein n=1 Tax=Undibacterium sp. CY21W TaxID=2762293 RepID=UPI00164CD476|nr:DUF4157 domain-containing protein [Undibacterium sp. CY21W]MBC3929072.1 DUF4157 domain-containing protein [Undibacterium sp. CY21W]
MSSAAPMQHVKTDATPTAQRSNQPSSQLATQRQQSDTTIQSEFTDQRPQATTQRQLQNAANNSPQNRQLQAFQQMAQNSTRATQLKTMGAMMKAPAVQRQEEDDEPLQVKSAGEPLQREATADAADAPKQNNTGLPDHLKSGIESLSGMSMDHVKVHYNSSQPAQLNAHAYAQGSEIHVGPGQEQHLPHEAWHVVQQAQGRVQPTMQMKAGVPVNDDVGLEAEADVMGEIAMHSLPKNTDLLQVKSKFPSNSVVPLTIQRRGFSYEGGTETTEAYPPKSLKDGDRTDGTNKFTTVDYEANLPTPREVLLKAYKDNFIQNSLSVKEMNFDRPKKVEAVINSKGSERKNDPIETKIGHLGGDEWKIRGAKTTVAKFVGGHLIGNQIIGGGVADKAWNIAPQDEKNNSPSYNHTIEQMVRGANIESGGFINYEVELFYKLENYQVNTQTLIDRKFVRNSGLKTSMPAAVQIPTRIPSHWKAKASVNRKAKFAAPTQKKNPGNNEDEGKTYLQYVDEDPFKKSMSESNNNDKEYSNANFHLNFKISDSKDVSLDAEELNAADIQEVSYHMVQEHISTFEDTDTVLTSGTFGSATNYATAESSKGKLPTEIDYEKEFEKLKEKFNGIELANIQSKYEKCKINLDRLENNQLYNEWSEFWERAIKSVKSENSGASNSSGTNYKKKNTSAQKTKSDSDDSKKRKLAESSESKVKKVKRDETLLVDPTVHSDKEEEKENLKKQLKRFLDKKRNQNIGDLKCISMTESMNRNDIEMHDLKKYIEAIDRLQDYEIIKAAVTLEIKKLSESESEPNIETINTLDKLYKQWQNFAAHVEYATTSWSDNFKLFFLGPSYLVFQEKEYFSVSNPRTGASTSKTFQKYYEENFDNKNRSQK